MIEISKRLTIILALFFGPLQSIVVAADEGSPDSLSAEQPDSSRSQIFALPIAFYSPQTELAAGVLLGYMFPARAEWPSSNVIYDAYYTINNQFSTSVQPFFYWKQDLWRLEGEFTFQKWPDLFYGLGSTTSKDDEEEYTTRNIIASAELQRRLPGSIFLGLLADFRSVDMLETEEDGLLSRGIVRGSQSHNLYGGGLSINRDTRDNVHFPDSGGLHKLSVSIYGGDYEYEELILNLRGYRRVYSDHVLAFQLYGAFLFGEPPFTVLPQLGETIRGYYPLRYIDRKLLAAQAEYRWPTVWRRFALAFFAGAGSVADDFEGFKDSHFKFGGGAGLRYLLFPRESLNVRLDIGFGGDGYELYVAVDEAF
jgi:hypothetical protein